jgi:hydroxylamine reductase
MFCNQCEESSKGLACTVAGVCGKKPRVAALQDVLLHVVKDLSIYADAARKAGTSDAEVNYFTDEALFATGTNVNFDPQRLQGLINRGIQLIDRLQAQTIQSGANLAGATATYQSNAELPDLIQLGEDLGHVTNGAADVDIRSLQQVVVYGIKGVAAYAHHARLLGQEDEQIYEYIHRALAALADKDLELNEWLDLVLECGKVNLRVMELLDTANTTAFGHPTPTSVPLGHRAGRCILISGHDLQDLFRLLEQTEGKGIYVYTHGEMLPAHGYPELKKFKHFYGHYGTAWQNQKKEFAQFPGAILVTTNCIQQPQSSYADNIFTTGPVAWPGVEHVTNDDFGPVIARALALPGYESDKDRGQVMVGFAHQAVLGVADQIIEAVKKGDIRHFLLVGGCDGSRSGRNYYTELVEKTPADTVVLTLACGKFRFFDKQLGDIGGIPRLLDVGQCNDAYSAIQIAVALAQAFKCGVNDLPLSMILSWYEQKAVSILLTLLYLGIKGIRLGPTLPAFVSPGVLEVLVKTYGLKPITTPEQDLADILG